jgi:hypothetical protein
MTVKSSANLKRVPQQTITFPRKLAFLMIRLLSALLAVFLCFGVTECDGKKSSSPSPSSSSSSRKASNNILKCRSGSSSVDASNSAIRSMATGRACNLYIWNAPSALLSKWCLHLQRDRVYEGRGGKKVGRQAGPDFVPSFWWSSCV